MTEDPTRDVSRTDLETDATRTVEEDGPLEATDLRTFQLAILYVLGESGPDYGLGLKRSLQAHLDETVHTGRLYPNLDELFERGLIEKRVRDSRTNEYALSDRGRALVRRDARRRAAVADGLTDGA